MKTYVSFGYSAAWITVASFLLPCSLALGASPGDFRTVHSADLDRIGDIVLMENGLFIGRVVDSSSRPQAGTRVAILSAGQTIASTETDTNGVFAIAGLRGGVHQIATEHGTYACRLWANGTAPPGAGQAIEIGAESVIARGQWGPPPRANNFVKRAKVMATNPFVVGGVVAAAVAIPVAIHNADKDSGPSS